MWEMRRHWRKRSRIFRSTPSVSRKFPEYSISLEKGTPSQAAEKVVELDVAVEERRFSAAVKHAEAIRASAPGGPSAAEMEFFRSRSAVQTGEFR